MEAETVVRELSSEPEAMMTGGPAPGTIAELHH
jgi:hypothetical protein